MEHDVMNSNEFQRKSIKDRLRHDIDQLNLFN